MATRNSAPLVIGVLAAAGGILTASLLVRGKSPTPPAVAEAVDAAAVQTPASSSEAPAIRVAHATAQIESARTHARDGEFEASREDLRTLNWADVPRGEVSEGKLLRAALNETPLKDDGRGSGEMRCGGYLNTKLVAIRPAGEGNDGETQALKLIKAWRGYPHLPEYFGEPCAVALIRAVEKLTDLAPTMSDASVREAVMVFLPLLEDHQPLSHQRGTDPADLANQFLSAASSVVIPAASASEPAEAGTIRSLRRPESWPTSWNDWWTWASKKPVNQWRPQALATARRAASDKHYAMAERAARLGQWFAIDPTAAMAYGQQAICNDPAPRKEPVVDAVCFSLRRAIMRNTLSQMRPPRP